MCLLYQAHRQVGLLSLHAQLGIYDAQRAAVAAAVAAPGNLHAASHRAWRRRRLPRRCTVLERQAVAASTARISAAGERCVAAGEASSCCLRCLCCLSYSLEDITRGGTLKSCSC